MNRRYPEPSNVQLFPGFGSPISKGAEESFRLCSAKCNVHPEHALRITIQSGTVSQSAALINSPSLSRSWALASPTTK